MIVLVVLLLGAVFIWGIFSNFGLLLAKATPFPIDLHSASQANYQKDPDYMQIPPMDIQLVIDAIWDLNLNSQNLSMRLTQVNENFIASVSSVTPQPTFTNTPEISNSDPDSTLVLTPGTPAATMELTPSFSPTVTPPGFAASATASSTSAQPSNTPSKTPPLPTNTVTSCGSVSVGSFVTGEKKVTWTVSNNAPSTVTINRITLSWPAANTDLDKVFFGQSKIWDGTGPPPSIVINPGSVILGGNLSNKLSFYFLNTVASGGYNISITYNNGCSVSRSN